MSKNREPLFRGEVDAMFNDAHFRLRDMLPSLKELSDHEIAAIFVRYTFVFHDHFTQWMTRAWVESTGDVRRILAQNLLCEIQDDHPELLLKLAHPAFFMVFGPHYCFQSFNDFFDLKNKAMRYAIEPMGVNPLYSLALLEGLSLKFIPWMKKAARKIKLSEQEYLEIHGVVDVKHAVAMKEAVVITMVDATMQHGMLCEFQNSTKAVLYALNWIFTGSAPSK